MNKNIFTILLFAPLVCLHVYSMDRNNRKRQREDDLVERVPEKKPALLGSDDESQTDDNNNQLPSLHRACISGDHEQVNKLLRQGFDKDAVDQVNYHRPLNYAIEHNNCQVVETLLREGSAIEFGDEDGLTPLHRAALSNNKDIVTSLLRFKADVNTVDNYAWSPLHYAAMQGYTDIIELLLNNGANPDISALPLNRTPLHTAAINGQNEVVKILLNYSANINAIDHKEITPLHCAAYSECPEIVKILLNAGADPGAFNCLGQTPFEYAFQVESEDMIASIDYFLAYKKNELSAKKLIDKFKNALDNIKRRGDIIVGDYKTVDRIIPQVQNEIFKFPESKECPICANERFSFVRLPCEHSLCYACLYHLQDQVKQACEMPPEVRDEDPLLRELYNNGANKCPVCREWIPRNLL